MEFPTSYLTLSVHYVVIAFVAEVRKFHKKEWNILNNEDGITKRNYISLRPNYFEEITKWMSEGKKK